MGVGRDRNAVMYENVSEKRLKIFLGLLDGFEQASTIAAQCAKQLAQFKSARLRSLISTDALSGGAFPDLTELLKFFRTSFDEKAARAQGCIVLAAGVDEELDAVMLEISEVEAALQEHLKEQRDELRDRSIVYFSRGKERYQLEVPAKLTSKVPDHYELMSQTKVNFIYLI
jgi:DNA mismatch repair ATPase MutS